VVALYNDNVTWSYSLHNYAGELKRFKLERRYREREASYSHRWLVLRFLDKSDPAHDRPARYDMSVVVC
jgi:hypothetical protein